MNLPNQLTTMRVILIPFFVVFFMVSDRNPIFGLLALITFILASFTDFLDGYIARKFNMITNFGKLMDPLADKLLVTAALVLLTQSGDIPVPVTIVIISREFAVSGLRQVAAEQGLVLAAGYLGKFKTVFQMIFIILMLTGMEPFLGYARICMWIALALTIISMIEYFWRNRRVLKG